MNTRDKELFEQLMECYRNLDVSGTTEEGRTRAFVAGLMVGSGLPFTERTEAVHRAISTLIEAARLMQQVDEVDDYLNDNDGPGSAQWN